MSPMRRVLLAVVACLGLAAPALAQPPAGVLEFYHTDAIGSVRVVTDAAGHVVRRHDYFPFGEGEGVAARADALRFSGKERDAESGLDYFGARYYAQRTGRFTTVDPLMDINAAVVNPQRWNRYAYVSNNPPRKVDPTGGYEIDVHFYLTRALARAAGLEGRIADRIAAANQGVDDNPATGPFSSRSARRDFHFTDEARRRQLWAAFERSGSPEDLGVFFHAQQDSFSHEGFGPTFGHLFAGHKPDRTYQAPGRADVMARDTFDRLGAAAQRLNASGGLPWETVRPLVTRFNRARTLEEKLGILGELERAIDRPREP